MATLIRPIADAGAGDASRIAVQAFSESEALTALRNGSGNLELIGWHTRPADDTVTRAADSGTQAGTADEVSLTLVGRHAITAVRSGSGKLLLISWNVPPGLNNISRVADTGTAAGEARQIAVTAVSDTLLVTAQRDGSDNLLLISWRLASNGTLSRLKDSGSQAGEVGLVTIASVDAGNAVTAVRNGSGNLELIGWHIASDGSIQRWPGAAAEAGEVGEIAIVSMASTGPTTDVVTAVQSVTREQIGSTTVLVKTFLLVAWRLSPVDGTIAFLADSPAGTASHIAVCSVPRSPDGTPTILASMRRGRGNLEIIAFQLIADGVGAVMIRNGDYSNQGGTDVGETALAMLNPGRIASVSRIDDSLALTTYGVSEKATTLIRPIADANAGRASRIAVQAFSDREVLTALRNDAGHLELIGWKTAATDFTVTRAADSGTQAGTAREVALVAMGRRAVTAVRSGSGKLLLISWAVPAGLATITRTSDSGTAAGEASHIAMAALTGSVIVTAHRAGNSHLLLISWRLDSASGTLVRLNDSGVQAGSVSLVTITRLDANNAVTAVRNGSGNLELIGWGISASGDVQRWGDSGSQAGEAGEIAVVPLASGGPTRDVLTAVQDGSGNLLLIAWRLAPNSGTIERLADSGSQAGAASAIALTSTVTLTGTTTILASMRRGSGNLAIIAFEFIADAAGAAIITRTGTYSNESNTDVTETALAMLEPGRILSASRIDRGLRLSTYTVLDAATTPAPKAILALRYDNPDLSITNDSDWASSAGNTYPLGTQFEWMQVLARKDQYDNAGLVGCSGWVINPENSGADVPFTHPFGFDWEIQIALDDDAGYKRLLSPANAEQEGADATQLAAALGLPVTQGLLGVEWDKGLLPQSFRGLVNHGDRVAMIGRWILDTGHDLGGNYRTEIHPPLLVAAGSVQTDEKGVDFTRVVVMSRPFLAGQTFALDPNDAYQDASEDDGAFEDHMVNELVKVVTLRSRRVEAHPKIKSHPFRGSHQVQVMIRPPPRTDPGDARLVVSFQFTTRSGCDVHVSATSSDTIDVAISLREADYVPPRLPGRNVRDYGRDELDTLSSGAGTDILLADALVSAVTGIVGGIGLGAYVHYILERDIRTDEYDALPEINILGAQSAVLTAPADDIPAGKGVVVDDKQPYPIFGWVEARWVPAKPRKRVLTTAALNRWLKSVLDNPAQARQLKNNWVEFVLSEFETTKAQVESLATITPDHAEGIQRAVRMVVDNGGSIHMLRESEQSPGQLFVEPNRNSPQAAALSVGVFHCQFDAHCRNWHCGWGPARLA